MLMSTITLKSKITNNNITNLGKKSHSFKISRYLPSLRKQCQVNENIKQLAVV
jgi:hypothetical protein